ncbi:MAG TPA: type I phosphomannose isomerase catalytic subunit, partial [Puia sp.]|nr:type I phosphomannose isomerase catalytic subunit [Puia sp.]
MEKELKVFKLQGRVQHYAWGGTDFIPALLSVPNPGRRPFAEYWMGAHEHAPSMLEIAGGDLRPAGNADASIGLGEYIAQRPE